MNRQEINLALRDFNKNQLYWIVSVFSIALAIASVLVISHYVIVEKSYDKFHTDAENIYRIVSTYADGEQLHKKAMAPGAIGYYLKQNSSSIDNFCALSTKYGPEKIMVDSASFFYTDYIYATNSILDVFTFQMIEGTGDRFEAPETAIINETKARIMFGDPQKALGKIIRMQQANVTVVGVFRDFPRTSHFNPEFIIRIPEKWGIHNAWNWSSYYTYVRLNEDVSALTELELTLNEASRSIFAPAFQKSNVGTYDANLSLQALSDIHLYSDLDREIRANGSIEFVTILIWIAVLILITATLNFTNLYVTQFQNRLKEIGIRKINGSSGRYIFQSYFFRASLIILLSFALAMFFVFILFPVFPLDILESGPDSLGEFITISIPLLLVFLTPTLVMYPIVLGNTTTAKLIRGQAPLRVSSSFFTITLLFQFIISGFLVGTTLVMYNQFTFIQNKTLGLNPNQVIRIKLPSETYHDGKKLLDRTTAIAGVGAVALTGTSLGEQPGFQKQEVAMQNGNIVNQEIMTVSISSGFIELLEVELLDGRNVTDWVADSAHMEALVNESFVKAFGIEDPIGLTFSSDYYFMGRNPKVRIVGIVKDFHFSTLYDRIGPIVFTNEGGDQVLMKVNTRDVSSLLKQIEGIVREITGSSEFTYDFLDEKFARGYRSDLERRNLFLFFSSLALIIACLGLFALSSRLVLSKSKETGIRKVFGSTTKNLMLRYSISCSIHALIGLVVSVPVIYYYGNSWLENFAYKKEVGISVFIITITVVYSISLLTVLFNTYKAARLNPIESLRIRE